MGNNNITIKKPISKKTPEDFIKEAADNEVLEGQISVNECKVIDVEKDIRRNVSMNFYNSLFEAYRNEVGYREASNKLNEYMAKFLRQKGYTVKGI